MSTGQPPVPVPDPVMDQSRFADLSLWQSAVDEVVSRKAGAAQAAAGAVPVYTRPDPAHAMVQTAIAVVKKAEDLGHIHATPQALAAGPASGPIAIAASAASATAVEDPPLPTETDPVKYCADLARMYGLAKFLGHTSDANFYGQLLFKTQGECDPRWAEAAAKYAEFLASRGSIPYRRWNSIGDFVIDGKLGSQARIAIIGDWGTGQPEAINVLQQVARKNPDVVIHLGDIYYSGTAFEVENYFYQIWHDTLKLDTSGIVTFSLAGNHDMFCGGGPYYNLLDKLGQPASYFCLRNDSWQFIGIDTGLHDSKPDGTVPTYLEDTEVQWLTDKIQNAGGRKTVLLSHHQLFSAFENICGQPVNATLNTQLSPLLEKIAIWFWGHEHNQVIYKPYMNILARCIGHGAFPVGAGQVSATPTYQAVPVEDVRLGGNPFFNHGYVLVDIDGAGAKISYYQDTDETTPQFTETL
jgi:Calcineurin-like phosphoesterase